VKAKWNSNSERPLEIVFDRPLTLSLAIVCDRCRLCRDGDGRHPVATPLMHVVRSRHANPTDFELISQIKTLTLETRANFVEFSSCQFKKKLIKNENKAKKKIS
jgi:hypothetical protein